MHEELTLADPERTLALAYAPRRLRPALSALWRLDEQLGATVARTENPAVGQMRLIWWHDAILSMRAVPPADPVLIALADARELESESLLPLIDGWEALLEPLPLGPDVLAAYAEGRGASLFRVSAELLGKRGEVAENAGRVWALVDLAFRVSDRTTAERAVEMARGISSGPLPGPLAVLNALARSDARRGLDRQRRQGAPARIARAIWAGLTGR